MARNGGNASLNSEFVPTAEMMEDITRAIQNSFRSLMQGNDIEDTFELRETDGLSFLIRIKELFSDNLERIKMGAIEIMFAIAAIAYSVTNRSGWINEYTDRDTCVKKKTCSIYQLYECQKEFGNDEYIYSIPDADDEVHRTMEASRKQLGMVVVGMQVMIANERGRASRESDQQPEARERTSSDSKSLENLRDVLQELETGLLNSSRVTSQGKEIKVTRELRERMKKAMRDSCDCLALDKKVEETCELRETNPLAFKAGIIIHFLKNLMSIERDIFKIEKFCRKMEVLVALAFADDQLHRDMDSARKGIEKIVELLSAMKKDLEKAPASLAENSTSVQEASR